MQFVFLYPVILHVCLHFSSILTSHFAWLPYIGYRCVIKVKSPIRGIKIRYHTYFLSGSLLLYSILMLSKAVMLVSFCSCIIVFAEYTGTLERFEGRGAEILARALQKKNWGHISPPQKKKFVFSGNGLTCKTSKLLSSCISVVWLLYCKRGQSNESIKHVTESGWSDCAGAASNSWCSSWLEWWR